MVEPRNNFAFKVTEEKAERQKASVKISKEHINSLYTEALNTQKQQTKTYGFTKGNTPLPYIEQNFRPIIVEHLKELLFTHCVVNYLYAALADNKIVIAGDPDLVDITIDLETEAEFVFSLVKVPINADQRWKKLSLRRLSRKNYKDLDRQVESFVEEETKQKEAYSSQQIGMSDWVNFEISLCSNNHESLMKDYASSLWIRIQEDEADLELHELFLNRKKGESFYTKSPFLQEYVSLTSDMDYLFSIKIIDILPHTYFSLDHFKHHFSLKTEAELNGKMIEVFSTRQDISLRREIVEATFKLLGKHYFFSLPKQLLERQKKMVLESVQSNPDYHVYKAQDDFQDKIKLLAEKQLREAIIIDAIAYQEGIKVTDEDIAAYLNLFKRARMKEFMYFRVPIAKAHGQDLPLPIELVKRYCLREKTLNHVIRTVSRDE